MRSRGSRRITKPRHLLLLAALTALLVLPAAGAAGGVPTLTPGVLTVALTASAPRFQSGTVEGGRVVAARGFEVDLTRELASALGTRVDFVHARSSALRAPGPKPWDVAVDRITEVEAARAGLQAVPYLDVPQGVLLRRGLRQPARSLSDLRWLRLCAGRGSAGARLVQASVRPVEPLRLVGAPEDLEALLAAGRCDAAVADAPVLGAERTLTPGRYGPLAGRLTPPASRQRYVLALPADSALAPVLRQALRALERDQAVRRLARRWLGFDPQLLPVLRGGQATASVTLIGDSVSAALNYSAEARTLLAQGLRFRFEARPCRRLASPSCGHPPPPTALETIASDGPALGQVVIMDVGYNDSSSTYAVELDDAMRSMLRAGVRHVIWVTLRERYPSYRAINETIRASASRWPELEVADWNAWSAGRPWFAKDGLHLNVDGALGLARLLRPLLAPLAASS